MPAYQDSPSRSSRPFVTSPYSLPAGAGALEPTLPASCPHRTESEAVCSVLVHHRRSRKTGPRFPLTVASCATHGHAFTIYPPGHFPYGREALAPVTPDGREVLLDPADETEGLEAVPQGALPFAGTIFSASLAAAAGHLWPPEGHLEGVRSSQRARVSWATRCLGVDPALEDRVRERLASILQVPLLKLRDAAARIRDGPSLRTRACAVVSVLDQLRPPSCAVDRLAVVGSMLKLWGASFRVDAPSGFLHPLPFPIGGIGRRAGR